MEYLLCIAPASRAELFLASIFLLTGLWETIAERDCGGNFKPAHTRGQDLKNSRASETLCSSPTSMMGLFRGHGSAFFSASVSKVTTPSWWILRTLASLPHLCPSHAAKPFLDTLRELLLISANAGLGVAFFWASSLRIRGAHTLGREDSLVLV